MTAGRAGRLHVGDFVRFDDAVHEVVGLDGAVTILMSEAGRRVVMKVDALLCDPTFEMIDSADVVVRCLLPTSSRCRPRCGTRRDG